MTTEEYFDGQCPYTDRPCRKAWDCANCEVETEERLWAEGCDNDCEHCEWATCPKMEVPNYAETITYTGTNGYTGKLVPWIGYRGPQVALWIFGPDGNLTLHTGNTPARTMEDLKERVEGIEEFIDGLYMMKEDTTDDDI